MILKILWMIGLSIISGILYKLGGTSAGTKWRDIGCPLIALLICLWLLKGLEFRFWWAYLLTFGLGWASMTTYWKRKGTDAKWWNWLLTGLGYSLAFLPIAFATGHWIGFIIRTIILTYLITAWSEFQSNATWEEFGRGFLYMATIPLLLI